MQNVSFTFLQIWLYLFTSQVHRGLFVIYFYLSVKHFRLDFRFKNFLRVKYVFLSN